MRLVLPAGSFAHSAGLAAESMRMTPYLRIPISRSVLPMPHAFFTCVRKRLRSSLLPIADPPPVGGHTGATSEPTTNPRFRMLSASRFNASRSESMSTCGSNRKRSTPSNRAPSTSAAAVRSSIVSRSIGGSESGPLPTRPGHIALCKAGFVYAFIKSISRRLWASASSWIVRIAGSEVLQQYERLRLAEIFNAHAVSGSVGGHEELVLSHFAEPDHRRCRHVMMPDGPVSLCEDETVRRSIPDRHRAARHHRPLLGRIPRRAVAHPPLAVPCRCGVCVRVQRARKHAIGLRELRVHVRIPIEHADAVVEVVVKFGSHVFR